MLQIERRYQIIILLFLAALLFGGGIKYAQYFLSDKPVPRVVNPDAEETFTLSPSDPEPALGVAGPEAAEEILIYVHVVGAVQKNGVYQLPIGSRVFEALEHATPLPEADLQRLNLAQQLQDEQRIYVPHIGEELENIDPVMGPQDSPLGTGSGQAGLTSEKVNINTASKEELASRLSGIGPTLAQRIVDYREQNGRFRSIEDIQNVSGIGEKRFSQIKDSLTVR